MVGGNSPLRNLILLLFNDYTKKKKKKVIEKDIVVGSFILLSW